MAHSNCLILGFRGNLCSFLPPEKGTNQPTQSPQFGNAAKLQQGQFWSSLTHDQTPHSRPAAPVLNSQSRAF